MIWNALPAIFVVWSLLPSHAMAQKDDSPPIEIQVVDRETGRGVPMVELITIDDLTYMTDNAGRVAFDEPEIIGQTIFFRVVSAGYQCPKDGFGIEGVRLKLEPGKSHRIELTRTNVAERLYRITGRNLYLDSVRLGKSVPLKNPLGSGMVLGQDSVQTAILNDRMYWFWGDTNRLSYPLGLFRTAGATSPLPGQPGNVPSDGIDLDYFTNDEGFARAMVDVPQKEGVVWIHGLCVVTDKDQKLRMVTQYSRRKGLAEPLEQGHLVWNDDRKIFEILEVIDLADTWRILRDHPVHVTENGVDYVCFGNPFPVTRVPATLEAIQDRSAYESFTCVASAGETTSGTKLDRNASGKLMWSWKKAAPVTQQDEQKWIKAGLMKPEEARLLPVDADKPERRVLMHAGSVYFNAYRKRWIMIANELAWDKSSPSHLGEVYYSEAESPTGPFVKALKVASHPKQSFYNPVHHPEFDEQQGQRIYFEGTYTNSFTNSPATPQYNYNQLMYRLDLDGKRIREVFDR
ncbi:MAG: hypothetical protein JNM43_26445 [Planctomycetaceae bacterium]|nr:hypothetical protein [Planctomycetaceae bacterium]